MAHGPNPLSESENQQLRLLELFVAQATARTVSELVGIHRNSATLYYHKLRQLIVVKMGEAEPEMAVFECDESYFGGARKGRRGRGAAGKVYVFGILKRGGKVYALPVADATSQTLLTALKTGFKADSVVYTDNLKREAQQCGLRLFIAAGQNPPCVGLLH